MEHKFMETMHDYLQWAEQAQDWTDRLRLLSIGHGRVDWVLCAADRPDAEQALVAIAAACNAETVPEADRGMQDAQLEVVLAHLCRSLRWAGAAADGLGAAPPPRKQLQKGRRLLQLARDTAGVTVGPRAEGLVAAALARSRLLEEAKEEVLLGAKRGNRPTASCAEALFASACEAGTQAALEMLDMWEERKWVVPQMIWAKLIDLCLAAARPEKAQELSQRAYAASVERPAAAALHAAFIRGACTKLQVRQAVQCAAEARVWPHEETVHACIDAARRLGAPELADMALAVMRDKRSTRAIDLSLAALHLVTGQHEQLAAVEDRLVNGTSDGAEKAVMELLRRSTRVEDCWWRLAERIGKRGQHQELLTRLIEARKEELVSVTAEEMHPPTRQYVRDEDSFEVLVEHLINAHRSAVDAGRTAVAPSSVAGAAHTAAMDKIVSALLFHLETPHGMQQLYSLSAERVAAVLVALAPEKVTATHNAFSPEQFSRRSELVNSVVPRAAAVAPDMTPSLAVTTLRSLLRLLPLSGFYKNTFDRSGHAMVALCKRIAEVANQLDDSELARAGLIRRELGSRRLQLTGQPSPEAREALKLLGDAIAEELASRTPSMGAEHWERAVSGAAAAPLSDRGDRQLMAALGDDAAPKKLAHLTFYQIFQLASALVAVHDRSLSRGGPAARLLYDIAELLAREHKVHGGASRLTQLAENVDTLRWLLHAFASARIGIAATVQGTAAAVSTVYLDGHEPSTLHGRSSGGGGASERLRDLSYQLARLTECVRDGKREAWAAASRAVLRLATRAEVTPQAAPELLRLLAVQPSEAAARTAALKLCDSMLQGAERTPGGGVSIAQCAMGRHTVSQLALFLSSAAALGALSETALEAAEARALELLERTPSTAIEAARLLCAFAAARRVPPPGVLKAARLIGLPAGKGHGRPDPEAACLMLTAVGAFALAEPLVLGSPLAEALLEWVTQVTEGAELHSLTPDVSAIVLCALVSLERASKDWELPEAGEALIGQLAACCDRIIEGRARSVDPAWFVATAAWGVMHKRGAGDEGASALREQLLRYLEWSAAELSPAQAARVLAFLTHGPTAARRYGAQAVATLGRGAEVRWSQQTLVAEPWALPLLCAAVLRSDAESGGLRSSYASEITRAAAKVVAVDPAVLPLRELGVVLQAARHVGGSLGSANAVSVAVALTADSAALLRGAHPSDVLRVFYAVAGAGGGTPAMVKTCCAAIVAGAVQLSDGELCAAAEAMGAAQLKDERLLMQLEQRLSPHALADLSSEALTWLCDGLNVMLRSGAHPSVRVLLRKAEEALKKALEWDKGAAARRREGARQRERPQRSPAAVSISVLGLPALVVPPPDLPFDCLWLFAPGETVRYGGGTRLHGRSRQQRESAEVHQALIDF